MFIWFLLNVSSDFENSVLAIREMVDLFWWMKISWQKVSAFEFMVTQSIVLSSKTRYGQ